MPEQKERRRTERRYIPATEVRVVAAEGDDPPRIVGYAAVYNQRSEDLGGFVELIAPGAFDGALEKSDIRALYNHDPNYVLGRVRAGTLEVASDKKGLRMENTPPGTQWANDLIVTMERGDVDQMSFSFRTGRDRWEEEEGGTVLRTILEVEELFDVSPVTYPAYPDTTVAVRSLQEWRKGADAGGADDGEDDAADEVSVRNNRRARRLALAEAEG